MNNRAPRWHRAARVALSAVLAAGLAWTAGAQVATARDRDDVESEQQATADKRAQVEAALEDTDAQLAQTYLDLQDTKARLPQAQAELDAAVEKEAAAQRDVQDLKDRLLTAQQQQTQLTGDIAKGKEAIAAAQSTLAQMARSTYNGQTVDSSSLGLMLGVTSMEDLNSTAAARNTVTRTQTNALQAMQELEATNRNRQTRLDAVVVQIGDLKAQAEQRQADAEAARVEAQDRRDEIVELKASQESLAASLESQKKDFEAQDAALQQRESQLQQEIEQFAKEEQAAEAKRQEEERKAREAAGNDTSSKPTSGSSGAGTAVAASGRLGLPLQGNVRVTSEFGMRFHPILQRYRMHYGMDFGAACGTPVVASDAGTVKIAGYTNNSDEGKTVIISHGIVNGQSLMTGYLHLSSYNVSAGQHVNKGDVVGYVGSTGMSTGCHLHYNVYVNGTWVNPRPWLFG